MIRYFLQAKYGSWYEVEHDQWDEEGARWYGAGV
jgi:hypothetical protein